MTTQMTATGVVFPDSTTQTTAAGASSIPSGSVTNFYQAAAPTGWTQVTTMNDYAMRIVSGSGGTTGGTTAFSTVFSNQTPTISVNVSGLSAGATTLSTAQMPSHSHVIQAGNTCGGGTVQPGTGNNGPSNTNAQGGGGSHSHSISGSASGSSSAITLNVLYQNHILCSKN
jgi:hypothetical protein